MNTAELKVDLISKIAGINEESKLEEILRLLDFQSDQSIFQTSAEDKEAIQDGRNQISSGKFIDNDQLQNEIGEWLKK